MFPGVTALDAFLSILFTCALKGTFFLLVVGCLALTVSTPAQRHFAWFAGLVSLALLLMIDPWVAGFRLLPAPAWLFHAGFLAWAKWIWLGGLAICLARLVFGLAALELLRRRSRPLRAKPWLELLDRCRHSLGVRRKVNLLQSPGRVMPMTWGVLRSFIIVPATARLWPHSRARVVLLHELAHVRRKDFLVRLIRDVIHAIFWFHPLVWWAAAEMDEDREEASDDAVLSMGESASDYAEALASVAANRSFDAAPAMAKKPLLTRITSILMPWKPRHGLFWGDGLRCAALLTVFLAVLVCVDFRAAPSVMARETESLIQPPSVAPTRVDGGLPWQFCLAFPSRNTPPSALPSFHLASTHGASAKALPPTIMAYLAAPPEVSADFQPTSFLLADEFRPLARGAAGRATATMVAGDFTTPPNDSPTDPKTIDGGAEAPAGPSNDPLEGDIVSFLENVLIPEVGAGFGGAEKAVAPAPEDDLGFALPTAGEFIIASAGVSRPQPLNAGFSIQRLPSGVEPPEAAALTDSEPGVIVRPLVVTTLQGERHLAIAFKRKPNAPLASFQVQASSDLEEWTSDTTNFALVQVSKDDQGRQEVIIAMSRSIRESGALGPRFMRVRTKKL